MAENMNKWFIEKIEVANSIWNMFNIISIREMETMHEVICLSGRPTWKKIENTQNCQVYREKIKHIEVLHIYILIHIILKKQLVGSNYFCPEQVLFIIPQSTFKKSFLMTKEGNLRSFLSQFPHSKRLMENTFFKKCEPFLKSLSNLLHCFYFIFFFFFLARRHVGS